MATMEKLDLRKTYRALYSASATPALVDVPTLHVLAVDGAGDPNRTARYREAVEALYALSYALKFGAKRRLGIDYSVLPLEGLWWADDLTTFAAGRRDDWRWTMLIVQPDLVTGDQVLAAAIETGRKKQLPALDDVRFETLTEGPCAQVLHVGPYATEGPTIERLHAFIADQGLRRAGKHHEVYLGDPNRSAPDRLRTILRQPVARP